MKNRSNIMLRIASFLFVAVLASTVMLSGLLARYVTTAGGGDSARVIKFGQVSITETTNKYVICPGVNLYKDAKVSFTGSEAATYLFVEVDLSHHWQKLTSHYISIGTDLLKFEIDSANWSLVPGLGAGKHVYYYTGPNSTDGLIAPNTVLSNIYVIKDEGKIQVSRSITEKILKDYAPDASGKNGIDIDFVAKVVQANGFENVSEAWASVSSK